MTSKKLITRLKIAGLGITLAGILGLVSLDMNRKAREDQVNLDRYLTKALPAVISETENRFGIKFLSIPEIEAVTPYNTYGSYYGNKINLNSDLHSYPNQGFLNKFYKLIRLKNSKDPLKSLRHELGHVYSDQRLSQLTNGKFSDEECFIKFYKELKRLEVLKEAEPSNENTFNYQNYKSKNLLNLVNGFADDSLAEGIALYFERDKDNQPNFSDDEWKDIASNENLDNFNIKKMYEGGYSIVKPILDRFGGQGLDYILIHSPNFKSLSEFPEYRRKALEELSKLKEYPHEKRTLESISGGEGKWQHQTTTKIL